MAVSEPPDPPEPPEITATSTASPDYQDPLVVTGSGSDERPINLEPGFYAVTVVGVAPEIGCRLIVTDPSMDLTFPDAGPFELQLSIAEAALWGGPVDDEGRPTSLQLVVDANCEWRLTFDRVFGAFGPHSGAVEMLLGRLAQVEGSEWDQIGIASEDAEIWKAYYDLGYVEVAAGWGMEGVGDFAAYRAEEFIPDDVRERYPWLADYVIRPAADFLTHPEDTDPAVRERVLADLVRLTLLPAMPDNLIPTAVAGYISPRLTLLAVAPNETWIDAPQPGGEYQILTEEDCSGTPVASLKVEVHRLAGRAVSFDVGLAQLLAAPHSVHVLGSDLDLCLAIAEPWQSPY